MKPEDDLCDKLTAGIEAAMAVGKSEREIAHGIMPIVLAYEARARADERAKVAEEIEAACQEWSKIEGNARCDSYDEHQCHRVAGELSFAEDIRIARGERP